MRYLSLILSTLLLSSLGFAQQRYLISPNQEVIPLKKGQVASRLIARRLKKSSDRSVNATTGCSNPVIYGYTESKYPPTQVFTGYHKDVLGQWYVAQATGRIDTIFWESGDVGALDS